MKNAVLFAVALFIASSAASLPSYAAQGAEPEATATEPMKTRPAKPRHAHKHERHSQNLNTHRHHHRAA